jgi:hypothetical protein
MARRIKHSNPQLKIAEAGADRTAAIVVRYVRFMDDTFGAGKWEQRPGEPECNATIREGMFRAFKAGAGID